MNHDPFDIQGQEVQLKEAEERARREVQQEVEDYKWLMSSKRGRRVIFRVLERAGVYRMSFDTNAMTMAFNEGRRNEGLYLTSKLLGACPDLHAQMLKENTNE